MFVNYMLSSSFENGIRNYIRWRPNLEYNKKTRSAISPCYDLREVMSIENRSLTSARSLLLFDIYTRRDFCTLV